MGAILRENFNMLSLLNELVRCNILTNDEMDRLKIEFNEAGLVFAIIKLEQRNSFLEKLDGYIDKGVENVDIAHLQDVYNLRNGNNVLRQNDALVQTWRRIQKYVESRNCPIVAIVHALMVELVEV